MEDTTNWELAAVIAAVCIGLGGLLLFTLIGAIGTWRMQDGAARAATEVATAAEAMQELARSMWATRADERSELRPDIDLAAASDELADIRKRSTELLAQQALLQDAVRNLVEAGVLRGEDSGHQLRELEQALRRVEDHLIRITTPGSR